MDVLALPIQQVILEYAIRVHRVVEVATEALQFMGAVKVGLYLSFIKRIRFLKVHPPDIATLVKVLAVLQLRNFFDRLDPKIVFGEPHFFLCDFLPEVDSLT